MGADLNYSPIQVTHALQALARDGGDVDKTSDRLINDEFMVGAETLLNWKLETHAEQYDRISKVVSAERERQAVALAQQIIKRSGELQLALLEELSEIKTPALQPTIMRALVYASSKQTTQLMQLTNRPVDGVGETAGIEAMARLIGNMEHLGLIKVAPAIAATLTNADVTEEGAWPGGEGGE